MESDMDNRFLAVIWTTGSVGNHTSNTSGKNNNTLHALYRTVLLLFKLLCWNLGQLLQLFSTKKYAQCKKDRIIMNINDQFEWNSRIWCHLKLDKPRLVLPSNTFCCSCTDHFMFSIPCLCFVDVWIAQNERKKNYQNLFTWKETLSTNMDHGFMFSVKIISDTWISKLCFY